MSKKIQDQISKITVDKNFKNKSANQRQRILKWMPIETEIKAATCKQTFKILNWQIPEELAQKMPKNNTGLRISTQNKLATKPKWLNKSKITRASYQNRAYFWNTLPKNVTSQTDYKKFKKELKNHFN